MDNRVIINVGRQLGSGGHVIGRMLAFDFNANYYDRELLNLAAKESGFSEKIFEQNDERKGFFRGLLIMERPTLIAESINRVFRRRACSSFRAMPLRRLPSKAHVCLLAVVPTIS